MVLSRFYKLNIGDNHRLIYTIRGRKEAKSHAREIEEGDKSNIKDSESELYLIIEKLTELVNECMGVCRNLMISLRIIKEVMAKILRDGTFVLTDTMTAQVFR